MTRIYFSSLAAERVEHDDVDVRGVGLHVLIALGDAARALFSVMVRETGRIWCRKCGKRLGYGQHTESF